MEFVPYGGLSGRARIHRCGLDGCGGAQEGWGALGGFAALVHTIVLNAVKKGISSRSMFSESSFVAGGRGSTRGPNPCSELRFEEGC